MAININIIRKISDPVGLFVIFMIQLLNKLLLPENYSNNLAYS